METWNHVRNDSLLHVERVPRWTEGSSVVCSEICCCRQLSELLLKTSLSHSGRPPAAFFPRVRPIEEFHEEFFFFFEWHSFYTSFSQMFNFRHNLLCHSGQSAVLKFFKFHVHNNHVEAVAGKEILFSGSLQQCSYNMYEEKIMQVNEKERIWNKIVQKWMYTHIYIVYSVYWQDELHCKNDKADKTQQKILSFEVLSATDLLLLFFRKT